MDFWRKMDEIQNHAKRVRYWLRVAKDASTQQDLAALAGARSIAAEAAKRWVLAQPAPSGHHGYEGRGVRANEDMAVREDSKGDTESAFFYRAQASYLALKEFEKVFGDEAAKQ